MAMGDVRVVLVLPTSWQSYFEVRARHSIAWYAKRALTVAELFSPGAGVDVFLYGMTDGSTETSTVRTRLQPDGVDEWVRDWAVSPNGDLGVLGDRVPANRLEEFFGAAVDMRYARPLGPLREVCRWTSSFEGDKLVIFWLDWGCEREELVRTIAKLDRPDLFWQFFGSSDDMGFEFWRKDRLDRGGLVPNIRARLYRDWTRRSITRGFRKWRSQSRKDSP